MLMIRLSRRGARKQPHYRIVVIEKDRARDGRSVEVVGTYNPRTNPASIELKRDRIDYWTSKGAQLSDRVKKLVDKAPAAAATRTGSDRRRLAKGTLRVRQEPLDDEHAPQYGCVGGASRQGAGECPDEVEVEAFEEGGQTVMELFVAEDDLGRMIGRQGRMARSLRTIVNAAALRTRKRYQLEIVE